MAKSHAAPADGLSAEAVLARLSAKEIKLASGESTASLAPACAQLLTSGGKHLRVRLLLAAADQGPRPTNEGVETAANAVELLHLASLAHDDIIDAGTIRRGEPTAVSRFGPGIAGFAGAWIVSRAMESIAQCGPSATRLFADTALDMCAGGILELRGAGDVHRTVADYLTTADQKTARAMQLSGHLGAEIAGSSPDVVARCARFGRNLGMAWQIWDDLLDLLAETNESDKTPASDLRNSTFTLPVLFALEESEQLREQLVHVSAGVGDQSGTVALIRRTTGPQRAALMAEEFASIAEAELAGVRNPGVLRSLVGQLREQHGVVIRRSIDGPDVSPPTDSPNRPADVSLNVRETPNRHKYQSDNDQSIQGTPVYSIADAIGTSYRDGMLAIDKLARDALTVKHPDMSTVLYERYLEGVGPTIAAVFVLTNTSLVGALSESAAKAALAHEFVGLSLRSLPSHTLESTTDANSRIGSSVLLADHALASGFQCISQVSSVESVRFGNVARGAIGAAADLAFGDMVEVEPETCLHSISRYYGSLHANAAALGVRMADAGSAIDDITEFGQCIGSAFGISREIREHARAGRRHLGEELRRERERVILNAMAVVPALGLASEAMREFTTFAARCDA